jgi:hypothetical protein
VAERTRRYAKRPRAFAAVFAATALIAVLAVAGLAHLAAAPL